MDAPFGALRDGRHIQCPGYRLGSKMGGHGLPCARIAYGWWAVAMPWFTTASAGRPWPASAPRSASPSSGWSVRSAAPDQRRQTFSEAQFKTLKYHPGFPGRFDDIAAALGFCRPFTSRALFGPLPAELSASGVGWRFARLRRREPTRSRRAPGRGRGGGTPAAGACARLPEVDRPRPGAGDGCGGLISGHGTRTDFLRSRATGSAVVSILPRAAGQVTGW